MLEEKLSTGVDNIGDNSRYCSYNNRITKKLEMKIRDKKISLWIPVNK